MLASKLRIPAYNISTEAEAGIIKATLVTYAATQHIPERSFSP
jgi:hypothetical protein